MFLCEAAYRSDPLHLCVLSTCSSRGVLLTVLSASKQGLPSSVAVELTTCLILGVWYCKWRGPGGRQVPAVCFFGQPVCLLFGSRQVQCQGMAPAMHNCHGAMLAI